jgi:hypothetical protein
MGGSRSEVSLAEYSYLFAVHVKESFVTRLRVVRILARAIGFSLLRNVQTGCGALSAFFSFDTGDETVGT